MREILDELRAWNEAGEQIALATVVETWGSSPRPLGSRMAVTRSGKMAGSVSNGCIEGAVFEEAQKVLKSGKPKIAAFGRSEEHTSQLQSHLNLASRLPLEKKNNTHHTN